MRAGLFSLFAGALLSVACSRSGALPAGIPDAGLQAADVKVQDAGPQATSTDAGSLPPLDAGVLADVRWNDLERLVPTPPSLHPSTAMVRGREAPPGGERERQGGVAVTTRCGERFCVDGLKDLGTGREFLPLALTADEQEILAAPGNLQRVVKLARVGERHVSVYLGGTEFSGGAHSNNQLACATYDRRLGRPVTLSDVLPHARARALLQEASRKAEAFQREHGTSGYSVRARGFLYDEATGLVTLCAEAPMPMAGTLIEIDLAR